MTAKYEHELPSSFVPHANHDSHHDASHASAHEHLSQAHAAVKQAPSSESLAYHDHRHDDHAHTHEHALEHFHKFN